MKKYILTESQVKKIIDSQISEQTDFMAPINRQLAKAPREKRLFSAPSPFATIHLIKPGEVWGVIIKGYDQRTTKLVNDKLKDINNLPVGHYLSLEPPMGD